MKLGLVKEIENKKRKTLEIEQERMKQILIQELEEKKKEEDTSRRKAAYQKKR